MGKERCESNYSVCPYKNYGLNCFSLGSKIINNRGLVLSLGAAFESALWRDRECGYTPNLV